MKTIGNFTFIETSIKDVYIIEPKKYGDNRGYFMETYKEPDFKEAGLNYKFIQDNQSKSKRGVLRGLHFQKTYPHDNSYYRFHNDYSRQRHNNKYSFVS